MSTTTALTMTTSFTTQTVASSSLLTANVTFPLTQITSSANRTSSIALRTTSRTPSAAIMPTATSSPTPTPSHVSGLSKGASIGVGVGLAVAVLAIICGLLWFFSFHKRYQEDGVDELEIGPNATDYRRKASSVNALDSRPPTNHETLVGIQHYRSASMKSGPMQEESERPKAPTPGSRGGGDRDRDVEEQMRRDGFF